MPLLFAASAAAQHSQGYVFVGASGIPGRDIFYLWRGDFAQVGGGGEGAIGQRFTLAAEAGVMVSISPRPGSKAGLLSIGPGFHFVPQKDNSKWDPFIGAGFAALVSNGATGMGYYGGGTNYWFHRRLGLRVEFRDHVWSPESRAVIHFVGGRVGISFR